MLTENGGSKAGLRSVAGGKDLHILNEILCWSGK